ncbi:MAG: hypothetical protein IPO25_16510 [Saprospiraceae bacterium]|nr:hypothetical protein [Saprospiraceae bacterium]
MIRAQVRQGYDADSLHMALLKAANDTQRMDIYRKLGFFHQDSNPDTGFVYHDAQRVLAQKLNFKLWEADAYQQIAYCYSNRFRLSEAYENYMRALTIAEDPSAAEKGWGYSDFSYSKSPEEARYSIIGMIHFELSSFYNRTRNNEKRFSHLLKALAIGERLNNLKLLSLANRDISIYYRDVNMQDSAFVYIKKSLHYYQLSPYQRNLGVAYLALGTFYEQKREYDSAKFYMHKAIHQHEWGVTLTGMGTALRALGQVYLETDQLDSALYYTNRGKRLADSLGDIPGRATAFNQLATYMS